ncbi:conserved repeat domain-containing protein [Actinopolyspora lacussalsi subsp. righensis]|uniref:Conserved repeat domain-containing protein n=1 Tax=Actinopolyspora righensis TaxID=995060 RepID=A0A1I6ZFU5_9ACTN|nr:DUF11 domain-containing protein [Actinopolyspora righensis]SFT61557.1 conserved repeat domain-containing protein [Actinopolyspora righensis]
MARTVRAPCPAPSVLAACLLSIGVADGATATSAQQRSEGSARSPQLDITKTVNPNPMTVGAEAEYVITVTNSGDTDAADVVVTDQLDSAVQPGDLPADCSADGRTVTCGGEGTTVPAGESVRFTVPVTTSSDLADGTNIANSATVDSSTPGASGDSTRLVSQARTLTNVAITKDGPATVSPDGTITYTLTTTNQGPSDAVDVTLQDATNGQLTTIESASSVCDSGGLTVTCPLGTPEPGQSEVVTITLRVNPDVPVGTVIPNCAEMYTGTRRTTTEDDRSCVETNVTPTDPTDPPTDPTEPTDHPEKPKPPKPDPGDLPTAPEPTSNDGHLPVTG